MNQDSKDSKEEKWFYILAKDNSCQGYMPGYDKDDACLRFGLDRSKCSVVREVLRTPEGFKEINESPQLKLL